MATGSPFAPGNYGGRKIPIAQCNNVYIFPAIGLGVVASSANRVTDPMMLAGARALAQKFACFKNFSVSLLPPLTELRRVPEEIAVAVGIQAQKECVAAELAEDQLRRQVIATQWMPAYPSYPY